MAPDLSRIASAVDSTIQSTPSSARCKIGINGFGRIGRNVLRASLLRDDIEVVAINHTCASIEDVIYLILYDSTHGLLSRSFAGANEICATPDGHLSIRGRRVYLTSERDVSKLEWANLGVEYVAECTGKFKTVAACEPHITHGKARRVLISAPSADAPTFVYHVNSKLYTSQTAKVVSCASCTTNCVTPVAKTINDNFGIAQAFLTTVHASTRSQHVLDGYSKRDRRAGRSVLGNVIPTTTGAAKAVAAVLPELTGKITGISIRVPTANVSMVDLVVQTNTPTTLPELLNSFRAASKSSMAGVLNVTDEELVSSDFLGNSASAVIDAPACMALNDSFFKIIAWYDNEWAYSSRLLDMLALMAKEDATVPQKEAEVESVPATNGTAMETQVQVPIGAAA